VNWAWVWGPLVVGAAQLDEWSFGPFMWSRPIVLGPLLGWAAGSLVIGGLVGVVVELQSHDQLPLGDAVAPSAAVSAGTAVLLCARGPLDIPLGVPAGLAAGWLHLQVIELPLRRRRAALGGRFEAALAAGRDPGFGAAAARELALQFSATSALVAAVIIAGAPALARLWRGLPAALRGTLDEAVYLSLLAGIGMLAQSLRPRG
jgi:mannose/fructose/N-acetylgalactosamine-specific phosphotransferase system component IIC